MGQSFHTFNIEFEKELRLIVMDLYSSYEKKLLDLYIVVDPAFNQMLWTDPENEAERFYEMYREDIKAFLVREKDYVCNGTNVWLTELKSDDVKEWYEALIKEHEFN